MSNQSGRFTTNLYRSALSGGALLITLFVSACDDDPSAPNVEPASIRVIHLSPNAPNVDVYLNEGSPAAVSNLGFTEGTPYVSTAAGSYRIDVAPAGRNINESVLTKSGVMLEEGRRYTAVALDELGELDALALEDNDSNLASGRIRVRAIHAATAVGQVDIWNIPAMGSPALLYENVDFAGAGSYLDLPAGAYTLGFDVNDDASPDVVFSLPSLAAGTVANVFAVSNSAGSVFLLAQLADGTVARIDASTL
jgi:hypothetical protein